MLNYESRWFGTDFEVKKIDQNFSHDMTQKAKKNVKNVLGIGDRQIENCALYGPNFGMCINNNRCLLLCKQFCPRPWDRGTCVGVRPMCAIERARGHGLRPERLATVWDRCLGK